MPDYQNGKIYKIESLEGNCIYYGSTTQTLCTRMAQHRAIYKHNIYRSSSLVLNYNDAKIYLVEHYPCNTKEELCAREGYYIKNFKCVNTVIAGRDRKGWYDDNKEHVSKYQKQYYRENLKKYKKNRKIKHICECGSIMLYCEKSKHVKTEKHHTLLNNPFINFKL